GIYPSGRGFARREDESDRARGIGNLVRRDVDARRIRRVVANARAYLREDRLKDAAVIDAEAAANRRASVAAGHRSQKSVAVPIRLVCESETRIDVMRIAVKIIDRIVALLRRADVLIARAEVQDEVVANAPVVLRVHVVFLEKTFEIRGTEALLE